MTLEQAAAEIHSEAMAKRARPLSDILARQPRNRPGARRRRAEGRHALAPHGGWG